MITYKNYTLPYTEDDILEHLEAGSTDTAENWLSEAPTWEDSAYCIVEKELASDDIEIDTLPDEDVQELVEEEVQYQLDTYLVHVDSDGESLEKGWKVEVNCQKIIDDAINQRIN